MLAESTRPKEVYGAQSSTPSSDAFGHPCARWQPSPPPRMLRIRSAEKNSGSAAQLKRIVVRHRSFALEDTDQTIRQVSTLVENVRFVTFCSVGFVTTPPDVSVLSSSTPGSTNLLERSTALAQLGVPRSSRDSRCGSHRTLPSRCTSAGKHGGRRRLPSLAEMKALS